MKGPQMRSLAPLVLVLGFLALGSCSSEASRGQYRTGKNKITRLCVSAVPGTRTLCLESEIGHAGQPVPPTGGTMRFLDKNGVPTRPDQTPATNSGDGINGEPKPTVPVGTTEIRWIVDLTTHPDNSEQGGRHEDQRRRQALRLNTFGRT